MSENTVPEATGAADDEPGWVLSAYVADQLGVQPDELIRKGVSPELWKAIREFVAQFDPGHEVIDLDPESTTFLDLPAVPASLYADHIGEVPSSEEMHDFAGRDDMIDFDLGAPETWGADLEARRAARDAEANAKCDLVPGLYAAENLCRASLTDAGRSRLAELTWVAISTLDTAGALEPTGTIPTRAQLSDWCTARGISAVAPVGGVASLTEVKVALTGRNPNTRYPLTAIAECAEEGMPWALTATRKAQADNLDTGVRNKPHSFTFAELVGYGAPADDLARLTPVTPDTRLDSLRLLREWAASENSKAQENARSREAARKAAELPEPELFLPSEFEADRTPHLVHGLFKGGDDAPSALLVSQRKGGKSSVCDELGYALTTGEKFCGQLPTHLPAGSQVVIIDTEMAGGDIYDTYVRCRPLLDDGRVTLWKLIGQAGQFDLRTEGMRRLWHDRIPLNSVIIVDCLNPILSAAGIEENHSDVAMILDGMITLARERQSALFLAHHMGKDDEKGARGHSSIEGKFGAVIHMTFKGAIPDGSTPRYLQATGRSGIGLAKRMITRNDEGHLVMDGSAKTEAMAINAALRERDDAVFRMIGLYPGRSVARLVETHEATEAKWSADMIRDSLARLESAHRGVNLGNGGGGQWVPQWVRDPNVDLDGQPITAENANGLAVEGSTAHEAAVQLCVEAICSFVARDPAQATLTEAKMFTALQKTNYPPRKIHLTAFQRWKAACGEADEPVTDPGDVPALPTPEWSRGQVHEFNRGDGGDGLSTAS